MPSRAVLAFTLAALAELAQGENCSTTLITSLINNTEFTACTTGSGVSIATLTSTPTVAQETSICTTDACLVLLRELLVMNTTDCSIPTTGLLLQSQLIQPLFVACSAVTANESTSGSDSGSSWSLTGSSSSDVIDTAGSSSTSTSSQGTSASPSSKSPAASESTASASAGSSTSATNSSAATSSSPASTGTNSTTHKTSSKNSTGSSGSATKTNAAFSTQSMAATAMAIVGVALWLA